MTENPKRCCVREIDGKLKLLVDGVSIKGNLIKILDYNISGKRVFIISILEESPILDLIPSDFDDNIISVNYVANDLGNTPLLSSIRFNFRLKHNALVVNPAIDTPNWIYRVSPANFTPQFIEKLVKDLKKELNIRVESSGKNNIFVDTKDNNLSVSDYIGRVLNTLKVSVIEASHSAGIAINSNRVEVEFDFPASVKSACEQYLLYFVEFLKDNGEMTTADIFHNGATTLFSVSPDNKNLALSKIFEALRIYLNLPSQFGSNQDYSLQSIEVQRLQVQIGHFQGQLALAQAAILQQRISIQQQDDLIDSQKLLIIQQSKSLEQTILQGNILVSSVIDSNKEDEEIESLLVPYLNVKKYDFGPLQIDLPKAVRDIKGVFKHIRNLFDE